MHKGSAPPEPRAILDLWRCYMFYIDQLQAQTVGCRNQPYKWFESNVVSSHIELASEPQIVGDTPTKMNERHKSRSIANFEKWVVLSSVLPREDGAFSYEYFL